MTINNRALVRSIEGVKVRFNEVEEAKVMRAFEKEVERRKLSGQSLSYSAFLREMILLSAENRDAARTGNNNQNSAA